MQWGMYVVALAAVDPCMAGRAGLALPTGPTVNGRTRRQQIDTQWSRHYRPQRKRSNEKTRAATTDLARLDIADWLAHQAVTAYTRSTGATSHVESTCQRGRRGDHRPTVDTSYVENSLLQQRSPHSAITRTSRQPESNDQPTSSLDDTLESPESQAEPADGLEDHGRAEPQSERSESGEPDIVRLSTAEQVLAFAKAMTQSIWPEIAAELGDTTRAREIKRQLAHHGWCDLFIGLVQVIETYQHAVDQIPESAKNIVKHAILHSSMQAKRPDVTNAVVDIVADRVWQAFKATTVAHVPLMGIITSEEAVRSLRILAVFTCPAPENHKEVREHALRPLGDDAKKILTEQTKARLAKLFNEWPQA